MATKRRAEMVCPKCQTSMVRARTTAGKGQFSCPNPQCPDSFKVWYER